MWMQHYNANTVHKESWPREIWIGYNIELAEYVYCLFKCRKGENISDLNDIVAFFIHLSITKRMLLRK